MSVAQTTRLTAIWGTGTILAMVSGGATLIKRWGYMRVLHRGLVMNIGVFVGLIAAGWLGHVGLFMTMVFLLGIGTGLSMAGLLTAVIEFTTFMRAGLLMGVWGTAAELGQALGGLMGGVVVDAVRWLTGGNSLLAYSTVFSLEALLLLVTLSLCARLSTTLQNQTPPSSTRTEELTAVGLF
jgi:BCD family chlorophyll transporter-like MFS transporter